MAVTRRFFAGSVHTLYVSKFSDEIESISRLISFPFVEKKKINVGGNGIVMHRSETVYSLWRDVFWLRLWPWRSSLSGFISGCIAAGYLTIRVAAV